jgi:hypothetical protein
LAAILFIAVKTEQALNDANPHHADDGSAFVAAQFDRVDLDDSDNAAAAIDATEPVWHGQASSCPLRGLKTQSACSPIPRQFSLHALAARPLRQ